MVRLQGEVGADGAGGAEWRRAFIAFIAYIFRPILSRDKVSMQESAPSRNQESAPACGPADLEHFGIECLPRGGRRARGSAMAILAMLTHRRDPDGSGRDAHGTNKFMATSLQPVIPDGLVGVEMDRLNPENRQPASIVVSVSTGGGKITKLDILTVDALHPD